MHRYPTDDDDDDDVNYPTRSNSKPSTLNSKPFHFVGTAIQLVGMPGDLHNRCGVSVCTEWDKTGKCILESWQVCGVCGVC